MTTLFTFILAFMFPFLMLLSFRIGINSSSDTVHQKKESFNAILIGTFFWISLVMMIAYNGLFEYHTGDIAPRFLIGLIIPVTIGLIFFRSAEFRRILNHIPQFVLVGIQFLRVFGISFLFIALQGNGPSDFAMAGYGDLVTGLLAIVSCFLLLRGSSWSTLSVILFNAAGLFDLVNVSRILLYYYPTWYSGTEPSTAIAGTFPTVLILCIAAPIALLSHVYSIRALILGESRKLQMR